MTGQYVTCHACADRPDPDPECWACDGLGVLNVIWSPDAERLLDVFQELAEENERLRKVLEEVEWACPCESMSDTGQHRPSCSIGRALGRKECEEAT